MSPQRRGTGDERLSKTEIRRRARQFERLIRRREKGWKETKDDPERN